jgi:hypothetical protein
MAISSESQAFPCRPSRAHALLTRLPELGPTDARRLAAAHGLRPVGEECSGTSDKSGFATVGILDGALPTAAQ